jgi:FkbM family methyltransferase
MIKYELINSPTGNEAELLSMFNQLDPIVILDIGCNDAIHTIKYSRLFPNATIHAFEPIDSNVEKMKSNIKEFGIESKVVIHSIALSDENGTADFYLSSGQPPNVGSDYDYGDKSSSLFEPKLHTDFHPWCKFTKSTVKTYRYEDLADRPEVAHLIHLDVQGAELKVFRGMGDDLSKVKAVWMEVERVELYKGQPLESDVSQFMSSEGFKLIKSTGNDVAGDQLWVR